MHCFSYCFSVTRANILSPIILWFATDSWPSAYDSCDWIQQGIITEERSCASTHDVLYKCLSDEWCSILNITIKRFTGDLMPETTIGWIGTGVMGSSMCHQLLEEKYTLFIYNRTRSKADSLIEKGAVW